MSESDLEVGVTVVHRRPAFSASLYTWDQGKFNMADTQEESTGTGSGGSDGETLIMGPQVLLVLS